MREALFVSYGYPPIGTPGSRRAAKFTQYLPDYGWHPVVLTVKNGYNAWETLPIPRTEHLDVVRSIEIDPIKSLIKRRPLQTSSKQSGKEKIPYRVYTALAFPDRDWLWYPWAVRTGKRLLEDSGRNISVIFSSSPNMTNHLVAMKLKRLSGLPWIAEFRDPWYTSKIRYPRGSLRSKFERKLEKELCSQTDFLLSTSQEYLQEFLNEYGLNSDSTAVIHNGFDPKDFSSIGKDGSFNKFTIAHAGSFYDGQRDPNAFFQTIKSLSEERKIDLEEVEIHFYGKFDPIIDRRAEESGLTKTIRWHGFIPYNDLMRKLTKTFCLLLITHKQEMTFPSKIFDYMGCKRPVIAICSLDSTLANIVVSTGIGRAIDHDDTEGLSQAIQHYWNRWARGDKGWIEASTGQVQVYTRPHQAKMLAELFNSLQVKGERS